MYGIYANIGGILMVNVTICSIHGSYGLEVLFVTFMFLMFSKYVDSSATFSAFSGCNWARHFIWTGHQRAIPVGCTHSFLCDLNDVP